MKTIGAMLVFSLMLIGGNLFSEKERIVDPQGLSKIKIVTESDKSELKHIAKSIQLYANKNEQLKSQKCNLKKECIAFDKVVVKSMYYKSMTTMDSTIKNGELIIYVNPIVGFSKNYSDSYIQLMAYHEFGSILSNQ